MCNLSEGRRMGLEPRMQTPPGRASRVPCGSWAREGCRIRARSPVRERRKGEPCCRRKKTKKRKHSRPPYGRRRRVKGAGFGTLGHQGAPLISCPSLLRFCFPQPLAGSGAPRGFPPPGLPRQVPLHRCDDFRHSAPPCPRGLSLIRSISPTRRVDRGIWGPHPGIPPGNARKRCQEDALSKHAL